MKSAAWVRFFGAFFLAFSTITIAVNLVVDPYDLFRIVAINGLNTNKYYQLDRVSKSIRLSKNTFETIIFGTSRTLVGIDTNDNAIRETHTFNASLAETNIEEMREVFEFIIDNSPNLKDVIYGVDFLTFSDKRGLNQEFFDSLYNPEASFVTTYLRVLYSPGAFVHSLSTIAKNMRSVPSTVQDGYLSKEGSKVNHRLLFQDILSANFLINRQTYGCFSYDKERMKGFEQMVARAAKRNINIHLFISPLHARHYVAMDSLGITEDYIRWMHEFVRTVEKARKESDAKVDLWDFGGFNQVTMEKVPNIPEADMIYYWESSHYKKKTGSMILDTMLNDSRHFSDFGIRLTSKNIADHLERIQVGRSEYYVNFPEEIGDINYLYNSTASYRAKRCPERY